MNYFIYFLTLLLLVSLFIQSIYKSYENFETNKMHVYLLCFNEQILLPKTIKFYRDRFPYCKITIYDNESTDESVKISKKHDCEVITWKSDGIDENKYLDIKNNCWKESDSEWVIVCDMDEWLEVNESELNEEERKGTTILKTQGYDMVGESEKEDLSDLDFFGINKAVKADKYSKRICFRPKHITDINYEIGAHECKPVGRVIFSKQTYDIKHMDYLGIPFVIKKKRERYERNKKNKGTGIHYTNDIKNAKNQYNVRFNAAKNYPPSN